MDVEIKELPPLRIAAVRHVGPFTELGPAFERVCGWAGQRNLFASGTQIIGVFHDDPKTTAPAELRSDAAVTIDANMAVDADEGSGVRLAEIDGGTYAVAVLKGPYSGLPDAYGWLMGTWLAESGRSLKPAPSYEVYLNDASSTPPEELLTAIHLPLQ